MFSFVFLLFVFLGMMANGPDVCFLGGTSLVTCDFCCEMGQAWWVLWIKDVKEGSLSLFSLAPMVTVTTALLT